MIFFQEVKEAKKVSPTMVGSGGKADRKQTACDVLA